MPGSPSELSGLGVGAEEFLAAVLRAAGQPIWVVDRDRRLLGARSVNLSHFTPDGVNVTMAGWSPEGVHVPTGTRFPLEGQTIDTLVRDTAAPGRFDSYEGAAGGLAALLRRLGVRSEVGAPVVAEGRVWGALIAGTDQDEPLAAGTEDRLARFAELVATAISNAMARRPGRLSRAHRGVGRLLPRGDPAHQRRLSTLGSPDRAVVAPAANHAKRMTTAHTCGAEHRSRQQTTRWRSS